MSIEQNFMKAYKSSGGLTSGRLRNDQSAEPLWTATLSHMSAINHYLMEAETSEKPK